MINILLSESVILIADISVIGISVYLLIGAPLLTTFQLLYEVHLLLLYILCSYIVLGNCNYYVLYMHMGKCAIIRIT